jgi:Uma2 family endonuclease
MSSAALMQATLFGVTQPVRIELRYPLRTREDEWAIPENWPVPQSIPHGIAVKHLESVLSCWASRQDRPLFVADELAVRWLQQRPAVGIDPDLCVLDPPPPDVLELTSLKLWLPGNVRPSLCIEVVSDNHPYKDYGEVQERYAAFGAPELVVFDPRLIGPKSLGGPFAIQVWRTDGGVFERTYAGPGPAFSEALGAWVRVDDGLPQIASDRAGAQRWPTEAEFERMAAERERAEKEHERTEKERERAEKERERAEKERERAQRIELERRLAALEQRDPSRRD